MSSLGCAIGNHDWGEWELRPPTIGGRVPFVYWQRSCRRLVAKHVVAGEPQRRCDGVQRRWFRIPELPTWRTVRIRKPMDVRRYLAMIKVTVPGPDDPALIESGSPPEL